MQGPGAPKDELVALFEQVIFGVNVLSVVPVRFHLGETVGGVIAGDMEVVPADNTVAVGPVPKGVSVIGRGTRPRRSRTGLIGLGAGCRLGHWRSPRRHRTRGPFVGFRNERSGISAALLLRLRRMPKTIGCCGRHFRPQSREECRAGAASKT